MKPFRTFTQNHSFLTLCIQRPSLYLLGFLPSVCVMALLHRIVIKSQAAGDRLAGFKPQLYHWLQHKAELLGRKRAGAQIPCTWPSFLWAVALGRLPRGTLGVLESTICKLLVYITHSFIFTYEGPWCGLLRFGDMPKDT